MSLGLTKQQRRWIFRRRLLYWLFGILVIPVVWVIVVFSPFEGAEWLRIRDVFMLTLTLWSFMWAVLMVPVVFFDWFPASYYEDLETCPSCNEKALKVVSEAKCFECGLSLMLAHSGVSARADREPPDPHDNL